MQYYPIQENWRKIKKIIATDEVQDGLVENFNKFTFGRWDEEFKRGMVPFEFESCDWHIDRVGRMPPFWNYVKHSACH